MQRALIDNQPHCTLDDIVPEYDSRNPFARQLFHARLRVAAHHIAALSPSSLLDVGCGAGKLFGTLQSAGTIVPEQVGIDVMAGVRDLQEFFPQAFFFVKSILHTDFKDNTFDVITCLDTLEHIEQLNVALGEIGRIMKPGGHLITSEPTESVLYKLLRLLFKGTYSQESGPCAGKHYYNAREIDAGVRMSGFVRLAITRLPLFTPFDLFHINLYRKK